MYPAFLCLIVAALLILTLYVSSAFRRLHLHQLTKDLHNSSAILAASIEQKASTAPKTDFKAFVERLQNHDSYRISIISSAGTLIADTTDTSKISRSLLQRPEVIAALANGHGVDRRFSSISLRRMLYVAHVADLGDGESIVVRIAAPLDSIEPALSGLYRQLFLVGICIAIVAAILAWLIVQRLRIRIAEMQVGAEKFADGNLSFRLPIPRPKELSLLAHAMNSMAEQLNTRIRTIVAQKNQLDAVLSGMTEAVIAFDLSETVLFINPAAENLFSISADHTVARKLTEGVRNSQIQRLVNELRVHKENFVTSVPLNAERNRWIEVHCNVLQDDSEIVIGGLLVINEVTELRRLENIRKDFVANVSHELRTPITSILGFVETMLANRDLQFADQQRFLEIIKKHTKRLNAIIEDLLSLSRFEESGKQQNIEIRQVLLAQVLENVVTLCKSAADKKGITIQQECESDVTADIADSLVEQALVNLLDNAIKYSGTDKHVRIVVENCTNEFIFSVHDAGVGIPQKHLDRLFERFYRVDDGRSRKVGGTGLGLSIVKHIAQLLGGHVEVKSTYGQGSSFYLHIPK